MDIYNEDELEKLLYVLFRRRYKLLENNNNLYIFGKEDKKISIMKIRNIFGKIYYDVYITERLSKL